MSDLKLELSIREEDGILFKRCVRKLLDATFIVKDKDERLYAYISRESNRQDISDYLRMIGFDVFVDDHVGVAMLRQFEADEETVGLKRANVVSFTTEQYHLLLVLWEIYLENLGYQEHNTVSRGDLVDKIKVYEADFDKTKLNNALKLFKKYSLIDYDTKDMSEDCAITLYPSLQFGWNFAQFKMVAEEYMHNTQIDEEGEEDEEE